MPTRLEPFSLVQASDEDLLHRSQSGELEATNTLLDRYRRFVRAKARGYFLIGADFEKRRFDARLDAVRVGRGTIECVG